jgi:predicted  nucleic acid-binding Zn-ribbon protein
LVLIAVIFININFSELKSTLSTLESKDSKEGSSDQDIAALKNQLLSESQRNVKNQETIAELNNKIKSLQGKVQKAKHHLQKQADHIKVSEGSVESQEQASELVLLLQSQLSEQGEQLEKYQVILYNNF